MRTRAQQRNLLGASAATNADSDNLLTRLCPILHELVQPRIGPRVIRLYTVHLCLNTASTVVFCLVSLQGSTQVVRGTYRFASRDRSRRIRHPRLCIFARLDDSMGIPR